MQRLPMMAAGGRFGPISWFRSKGSPLGVIAQPYRRLLPVVGALGLLASIAEGVSIGTLIPLASYLLSDELPASLPAPIRAIAQATATIDQHSRVLVLGGFLILLLMARGVIQAANNILISHIDARMGRDLRNALAQRLLALDYPFFLRNETSRLVQLFSAHSWSVNDAIRAVLCMIPSIAGLTVIAGLLAWLDWRLFLLVMGEAAIIQILLLQLDRRQRQYGRVAVIHNQSLGERMLAIITAARVIRVFGQQARELARFESASDELSGAMFRARRIGTIIVPIVSAAIAIVFVTVIVAADRLGIAFPTVMAFLVLLARAEPHAAQITQARAGITTVGGAVDEVEWLLALHPSPQSRIGEGPVPSIETPIRFAKVGYAYPDGSEALHDIDLVIEPGVATALIGKSGAGKSTIVNLVCRLVEPAHGAIFAGERRLDDLDAAQWRTRLALAGQDVAVIDGTVAENIAYGCPGATIAEIADAAVAAGAADFIAQLAGGYDSPVGFEGTSLSGGQRQRIGLARALLRKPDLLILDEATNAVDAISEGEIMKLLSEHRHFRTVLVISHRRSTLAACQNGIVLEGGRIVEAGPLEGLSYYRDMMGAAT